MSTTGMMQRCWQHDYSAPSFYMITLVTEPRRKCLGALVPEEERVRLSAIGEIVVDVWRRASAIYPGVEACECVAMPDHFHGILWVKERLERPMGHIIKAFKRVSTQECRSRGLLLPPNPSRGPVGSVAAAAPGSVAAAAAAAVYSSLWQEGFQDTILLHKGQLRAMVNYIADNPRRLAVKLAHPDLFTATTDHTLAPGHACQTIGNRFLLEYPLKRQVRISRSISRDALAALKAELLSAADHGTVLVSPCISPGEKEVAHAVFDAKKPLIVLVENGFSPFYKPPGEYFNACAAGRLLLVAPFPYHQQKQPITREQCLTLNAWAKMIAECDPPQHERTHLHEH